MGVEVGQDRGLPGPQAPAEPDVFRNRTGRERRDYLVDQFPALLRSGVIDRPELLVALPGERDFVARVANSEFGIEPCRLFLGEVFGSDLQGPADPGERIALAAAVAQSVLLDPAADFDHHG